MDIVRLKKEGHQKSERQRDRTEAAMEEKGEKCDSVAHLLGTQEK